MVISTYPSNARVEVYNSDRVCVHTGQSPLTVMLPSGDGFFSAASYRFSAVGPSNERGVVETGAHLNGWYFGNIIFGGFIGLLIVDPATGAMYRMPETVHIDLKRAAAPRQ